MKRQLLFIALLGLYNQISPWHRHGGYYGGWAGPGFGFYVGSGLGYGYPYYGYPYYADPVSLAAGTMATIATTEAIKSSYKDRSSYPKSQKASEYKRQVLEAQYALEDMQKELKDAERVKDSTVDVQLLKKNIEAQKTLIKQLNAELRTIS